MIPPNDAKAHAPEFALLESWSRATWGSVDPKEGFFRQYLRSFVVCLPPWVIVGIISFAQDLSRRLYWDDPAPLQDAWLWALRMGLSAALTPFVLWLGAKWPIERPTWLRHLAVHALLGAAYALIRAGSELAILYPLNKIGVIGPTPWLEELRNAIANMLIFGLHGSFISYWVILSVQAAFRYYEKFRERERDALRLDLQAAELERQVAEARLGALKMQLQPHFLFNTLNAIVVLVRQQRAQKAEQTLTLLSDLLRAVLDDIDAHEVPLYRELEYLRLYLAIEQIRFADRLRVSIDADTDVLDAAVPHMGLQPIVENAVHHGIGQRTSGGTILIRAHRIGERVRIVVEDDGPGFSAGAAVVGRGMGLANLRGRLQQLHGERAGVDLESGERGGATVTVSLPYASHPAAERDALMIGEAHGNGEIRGKAAECVDR